MESFANLAEKLGLNSLCIQEPLKHMIHGVFQKDNTDIYPQRENVSFGNNSKPFRAKYGVGWAIKLGNAVWGHKPSLNLSDESGFTGSS